MFNKALLFFHTLRYLRLTQIKYRIWYFIRARWRRFTGYNKASYRDMKMVDAKLSLNKGITNNTSYFIGQGVHRFEFLNLSCEFPKTIDWNFSKHGKLWTYNINYFEFLHQADITKEEGLFLIRDFIGKLPQLKDAKEAFPTSLRIINWIKFLSKHSIQDQSIFQVVLEHLDLLKDNLEFHILGNHLLENAYALFFGAYYSKDKAIYKIATSLLRQELNEQILPDGAHFELSPMYHQLMLYRLLDCINLVKNNPDIFNPDILEFLLERASRMLAWLEQITFANGEVPCFNDTAPGIAPTSSALFAYANRLGIKISGRELKESGYRRFNSGPFELMIDAGNIGPDYIPSHAHSDTLGFVLNIDQRPFIVDVGISTYEKNKRRHWERSTAAHNTVQVGDYEQSEIWGGFRVARRAQANIINETRDSLEASHDGYDRFGIIHRRIWQIQERQIELEDIVTGTVTKPKVARFFFHPKVKIKLEEEKILSKFAHLSIIGASKISVQEYEFPMAYNQYTTAQSVNIYFDGQLKTILTYTSN